MSFSVGIEETTKNGNPCDNPYILMKRKHPLPFYLTLYGIQVALFSITKDIAEIKAPLPQRHKNSPELIESSFKIWKKEYQVIVNGLWKMTLKHRSDPWSIGEQQYCEQKPVKWLSGVETDLEEHIPLVGTMYRSWWDFRTNKRERMRSDQIHFNCNNNNEICLTVFQRKSVHSYTTFNDNKLYSLLSKLARKSKL